MKRTTSAALVISLIAVLALANGNSIGVRSLRDGKSNRGANRLGHSKHHHHQHKPRHHSNEPSSPSNGTETNTTQPLGEHPLNKEGEKAAGEENSLKKLGAQVVDDYDDYSANDDDYYNDNKYNNYNYYSNYNFFTKKEGNLKPRKSTAKRENKLGRHIVDDNMYYDDRFDDRFDDDRNNYDDYYAFAAKEGEKERKRSPKGRKDNRANPKKLRAAKMHGKKLKEHIVDDNLYYDDRFDDRFDDDRNNYDDYYTFAAKEGGKERKQSPKGRRDNRANPKKLRAAKMHGKKLKEHIVDDNMYYDDRFDDNRNSYDDNNNYYYSSIFAKKESGKQRKNSPKSHEMATEDSAAGQSGSVSDYMPLILVFVGMVLGWISYFTVTKLNATCSKGSADRNSRIMNGYEVVGADDAHAYQTTNL